MVIHRILREISFFCRISSLCVEDIVVGDFMKPIEIGSLEQQVMLAIMRLHPTGYGIAIQDQIEDRTGRSYSVGAIYAALDRLEEKGFIASKQGEPTAERGGRRKLYFRLTAPGQMALQQSLQAIDALRQNVRWKVATS
jgi:PadR family transcriptional regulator, regulatory protein PadR